MSDPRQEDRERGGLPWYLPTQVTERMRLKLSPSDDGLPFAQAVRQKEIMDEAIASYREHHER